MAEIGKTRSLDAILLAQRVSIADLVKAARLNSQLPGATFAHGAETVAQCLTDSRAEVKLIRDAIIAARSNS